VSPNRKAILECELFRRPPRLKLQKHNLTELVRINSFNPTEKLPHRHPKFFYNTQTPAKRYESNETKCYGGNPLFTKTKRAKVDVNPHSNRQWQTLQTQTARQLLWSL